MKKRVMSLAILALLVGVLSCAGPRHRGHYNTQRGAAVGAGLGAIAGQAIGKNTKSTLLGAGIGTLLGSIMGNAVDQSHQAAREAAMTNKRVVYYDNKGGAVESQSPDWRYLRHAGFPSPKREGQNAMLSALGLYWRVLIHINTSFGHRSQIALS